MKIVEFTKVGLQNFCCHVDPVEIEFESGKLTMVTGRNGAGKTAIFQSLPYALYGVCEKGKGEDVLNDKTKKNCHVYTEFKVDDKEYRVDRYVKYTRIGNTVTLSEKEESKWKVLFTGHKEVLPEIERMLMPYKLFINTLLFSQKVKTFFTDLKDSEQKEIFRKILKLDDYVLYQKQSSEDLKMVNNSVSINESQLATKLALLGMTVDEIEEIRKQKVKFESDKRDSIFIRNNEIEGLSLQINTIEQQINSFNDLNLDNRLTELNESLGSINQQLNSLSSEIDTQLRELTNKSELKISQLDQKFLISKEEIEIDKNNKVLENEKIYLNEKEKLDKELKDCQGKYVKLEKDRSSITGCILSLNPSKTEFEKSLQLKGGMCPTCYRDIDEKAGSNIKLKIDEINFKLNAYNDTIKDIDDNLTDLYKLQTNIQQQIKDLNQLYRMKNEEILRIANESITQLTGRLQSAKTKLTEMVTTHTQGIQDQIAKREEDLKNENYDIRQKLDITNDHIRQKNDLVKSKVDLSNRLYTSEAMLKAKEEEKFDDSRIFELEKNCGTLRGEIAKIKAEQSQNEKLIQILEFWKVGFSPSGIQSMLIDEAIPFMNQRASYYLDKISGGRYKVVFDTLKPTKDAKEFRDKISVDVFDTFTHADKRVKFSGGQERIVDIATILTLSDLQSSIQDVKFNLLLFDEIFDALDDENIGNVSGLIRQIASEKWIGLISHRHIDQVDCDDVIKLY